jgi:hypothetical protein
MREDGLGSVAILAARLNWVPAEIRTARIGCAAKTPAFLPNHFPRIRTPLNKKKGRQIGGPSIPQISFDLRAQLAAAKTNQSQQSGAEKHQAGGFRS